MVYEDFTDGWIEVDTGNDRIQFTANHVDHASTRNEDTYLYKDYGAGHFGDFVHLIDFHSDFLTVTGSGVVWMLANAVNDWWDLYQANETLINLRLYRNGGLRIWLEEAHLGVGYGSVAITVLANTWYYVRFEKIGTAFKCRVWTNSTDRDNNDAGAGSYKGEIGITLQADHSFRYLFACNTRNDGVGVLILNTDIENLDLHEAPALKPSGGSIVSIMETMRML